MNNLFSAGSRFLRADFHLHTNADKEFKYDGAEDRYIKDYVQQLKDQQIHIGVITNHNKFDLREFKALKKEAKKSEILILPGVELSVGDGSRGIHMIIVFNEEQWLKNGNDTINNFLDAVFLGTDNRESENARCHYNIIDTLSKLDKLNRDFFVQFAHIEEKCGFMKGLEGGRIEEITRMSIFKKYALGFQKSRTYDKRVELKDKMKYELAYVEGSDPKSIEDIGKGKPCYIKIGDASFDAVKFALTDFENRVKDKLVTNNKAHIKSISFQGGRLDGQSVQFSDELNTFIGIRGSGKSSMLELIRYALGIEMGKDAQDADYKTSLIPNSITSSGKITLNLIDNQGKGYIVEKIIDHDTYILNEEHEGLDISMNTIIKNPLYFGQKDLSKIEGYELRLLEKMVGSSTKEIGKQIKEKQDELVDNVKELLRLKTIAQELKENKTEQNNCMHKIKVFNEYKLEEKLKKQLAYKNDKAHIVSIGKLLKEQIDLIEGATSGKKEELEELLTYSKETDEKNVEEMHDLVNKATKVIDSIELKLKSYNDLLKEARKIASDFNLKHNSLEEEFAEIKREIKLPNLDVNDYVKCKEELDKLRKDKNKLLKKKDMENKLKERVKDNVRELNELYYSEYEIYKVEVDKINSSQNDLRLTIDFKGDKQGFRNSIENRLKGTNLQATQKDFFVETYKDFLQLFSDLFIKPNEQLTEILTPKMLSSIQDKFENEYETLLKYKADNKIRIDYHGKPLEKHSAGQRASALMCFILSQRDNDLILIDQPEEDLDNQVIYNELITKIKNKKNDVQFIFTTHNANIPVLGDAEQIITCHYGDENITLISGGIDNKEIQTKIVGIMEGGPDAFKKRNDIYNHWKYEE